MVLKQCWLIGTYWWQNERYYDPFGGVYFRTKIPKRMILLVSSYCRYRPSCWGSWTYNLCMKLTVFDIRGVLIWWTSLSLDKCIVEWGSLDASWWFLQMTWYFILVSVEHLSRCVCFEQHFNLVNCLISCRNYMFFLAGETDNQGWFKVVPWRAGRR